MTISKLLLILNYLFLLGWWSVINILQLQDGVGATFFSLGFGIYTFFLPVLFVYLLLKSTKTYNSLNAILAFLGVSMFGVGTLFWFYYDFVLESEVLFPSMSHFFYLFQFPFVVLSFIMLVNQSKSQTYNLSILGIFYIAVCILSYIFSTFFLRTTDLLGFIEMYFPLESFSVFLITLYIFLASSKNRLDIISTSYYIYYLLSGLVFWVIADMSFFYMNLTSEFTSASIPDIFYVTACFLIMYSYSSLVDRGDRLGIFVSDEQVFMQKTSYYKPISLN